MKKINYFTTKTIITKEDKELGTLYLALCFSTDGRMTTLFSIDIREAIFLDQLEPNFVLELKHDKSLTFQTVRVGVSSYDD